jgi:hypothetical protein
MQIISITTLSSISPLGNDPPIYLTNYLSDQHCFIQEVMDAFLRFVAPLECDSVAKIETLKQSDSNNISF